MKLTIEQYDPQKHDPNVVAKLISQADPKLMPLIYGEEKEAVAKIKKIMSLENSPLSSQYIQCAQFENQTVGIIIAFDGVRKKTIDKNASSSMSIIFGPENNMRSIIHQTLTKDVADDELYIAIFSVDSEYRGRGIGTQLMQHVLSENAKACLDVNIYNHKAKKLYEELGFKPTAENTVIYADKKIGNYTMRRV